MDTPTLKFDNEVQITLRSSVTGEVLEEYTSHNDISDDLLVSGRNVYSNDTLNDVRPWCFLLRDGPLWSGFTWDRKNPWAPYTYSPNNLYNGSFDVTANPHWRSYTSCSYVGGRWKHFYQWTQLADDLSLKALGLTGWDADQTNLIQKSGVITNAWSVFSPQSLIILPTPILVKGRKGGTQVQDILEISYYLSVVGVN